jgi:predicted porin
MKLTKKITLALGVLAAVSTSMAQNASNSLGLLGERYSDFNFGVADLKHVSTHGYSLGAGVNLPILPGALDLGATYDYSWLRGSGARAHANTIGINTRLYTALGGVKPFVGGAFAWQGSRIRGFGTEDRALWNLSVGAEIPVGALTLTPRIAYDDDFEESFNSSQQLTYAVEANYWLNRKTAVYGSVGYTDVNSSSFSTWNYQVGVRVRF